MTTALFLPRELFSPPPPAAAQPAVASRREASFASGEAVAADLLSSLPTLDHDTSAPCERRRQPRSAAAQGVDLYIG